MNNCVKPDCSQDNCDHALKELTGDEKGKYKITTSHGTHYIFDMDNHKAMRVPAEGRNAMRADNDWFIVQSFDAIEAGKPIHWYCRGIALADWYTWRRTTDVTSIEKYELPNIDTTINMLRDEGLEY